MHSEVHQYLNFSKPNLPELVPEGLAALYEAGKYPRGRPGKQNPYLEYFGARMKCHWNDDMIVTLVDHCQQSDTRPALTSRASIESVVKQYIRHLWRTYRARHPEVCAARPEYSVRLSSSPVGLATDRDVR